MKRIWSYIAMFALGLAGGIVAGVKLMGDQVEINIRKIKTKKGTSNIDIPISVESPQMTRHMKREEAKRLRIEKRKAKKDGGA